MALKNMNLEEVFTKFAAHSDMVFDCENADGVIKRITIEMTAPNLVISITSKKDDYGLEVRAFELTQIYP